MCFCFPFLVACAVNLTITPRRPEDWAWVATAAVACIVPLFLVARHLETKGRRGVLVGAAAMTGACILAAGACFAGTS